MKSLDWSDIKTQVVAGLILAAILGGLTWIAGLWSSIWQLCIKTAAFLASPVSVPVIVVIVLGTMAARSLWRLLKKLRPTPTPTDPATTPVPAYTPQGLDLKLIELLASDGHGMISLPSLPSLLNAVPIRVTAAIESLVQHELVKVDKGSFARMETPYLMLTAKGRDFVLAKGLVP